MSVATGRFAAGPGASRPSHEATSLPARGPRVPAVPPSRGIAPAKINLVLEVVGRRPDGYHELRSVLAPLELGDRLVVRVPARLEADSLRESGESCGPAGENLVLRAAALLREWSGRPLPALAFELRKRTPVGAGLGGGSSDAACALRLAARAWDLHPGPRQFTDLAARLGSDVPFFGLAGWGLVGGRGERLAHLPAPTGGELGVLLVIPRARLATRSVFSTFDALTHAGSEHPSGAPAADLAALLRRGLSAHEASELEPRNDLWPAASSLQPELVDLRRGLERVLGRPVHLSGSGPTLFVLYASPGAARQAAVRVRGAIRSGLLPGGPDARPALIATATRGDAA